MIDDRYMDELVDQVFAAWECHLTHCSPEPELDAMIEADVPIRQMPDEQYGELRSRLYQKQEQFWRDVERLGYLEIEYLCPECGLTTTQEVSYRDIVDERQLEYTCTRCGGVAYVKFSAGSFVVR